MTCPFANFHTADSNEVTENQRLSYEIYETEAEILRITKRLEKLRKVRTCLEEENNEKRLGTVKNVETEFKNIFGANKTPWLSPLKKQLKPLFASIVYTLKNLEPRLNERKVHVHNEEISSWLPKSDLTAHNPDKALFSNPPHPAAIDNIDNIDKIWCSEEDWSDRNEEYIAAEVLTSLKETPKVPVEDKSTYDKVSSDDVKQN